MARTSMSSVPSSGVYFLLIRGVVIYVGQTHDIINRILQHKAQLMKYDKVRFIKCDESKLSYYEKRWIEKFRPINNKQHKRKVVKIIELGAFRAGNRVKGYHMKMRKLTRLSRIGFGSWRDRQVGNMLECGRKIDIIQMYFNMSHITFFDDILDDIGITEEWRIAKPGSDREKGYLFNKTFNNEEMKNRKERVEKFQYNESKNTLKAIAIKTHNKGYHQSKNQH